MNKKEAIEKVKTMTVETFFSGTLFVKQQEVIAIIEQIGEPTSGRAEEAPRYLRNILARLRELPEHDRKSLDGRNYARVRKLKWSVKIVALISLYQVTKWIEEVQDDTKI